MRVDVDGVGIEYDVSGPDDGRPVVLELELVEPSLFLAFCPGSADRVADAIAARL